MLLKQHNQYDAEKVANELSIKLNNLLIKMTIDKYIKLAYLASWPIGKRKNPLGPFKFGLEGPNFGPKSQKKVLHGQCVGKAQMRGLKALGEKYCPKRGLYAQGALLWKIPRAG